MKRYLILGLLTIAARAQTPADPCAALEHLKLANATSISTERITTGTFTPIGAKQPFTGLPPFCRVSIVSSPAHGSHIGIEIWLPETNWNHRFIGTGNGGGAGVISVGFGIGGVKHGFAVANTDLGTAPSADNVRDLPEKAIDFGHRATHEMTVAAKAVVAAYYSEPLQHSYFTGCSTGGQQALSEAERYPDDYDGIIAGAPANNRTHLHSEFLWHDQVAHAQGDKSWLPPDLIKFVTAQVVAACHGKDGGAPTDNFLTDPRACTFSPESLPRCTADPANDCITPDQLATLKAVYAGPTNPKTGEQIYSPLPLGTEANGGGLISQTDNTKHPLANSYPFLWTLGEGWDPMSFSFDKDETQLDKKFAADLNANNPDLTPFQKRGGKLLMYTGTSDPLVPFPDAMHYYERVVSFEAEHTGTKDPLATTQSFFRYYLVPGMGHCGGGPGLARENDMLDALELWVEHDTIPVTFPANGNGVHRNLCAYPELPTYTTGDPTLASSFTCKAHPRDIAKPPADRYLH